MDSSFEIDNINLEGEIINNKYIVIYRLGNGGFATVWLSYNYIDNIYVAIKVQNTIDEFEGEQEIIFMTKIKNAECSNQPKTA
jgi:serine/threonine protein kinase